MGSEFTRVLNAGQVTEALTALVAFDEANNWKDSDVALRIGRIIRKLKSEVELIDKRRQEIERVFVVRDEDGNPVVDAEGRTRLENTPDLTNSLNDLMLTEETYEYTPIPIAKLEGALAKGKQLQLKGRWAGIFDETGIVAFSENEDVSEA